MDLCNSLKGELLWERYCLSVRPGLIGPKSTAHEYLSFPLLLCPPNGSLLALYSLVDHSHFGPEGNTVQR